MKCLHTFQKVIDGQLMEFPCGKCFACLSNRISGWSFRLVNEDRYSECSTFVTFTYAKAPVSPNGFMTLFPRDMQLFMKRLRKLDYIRNGKAHRIKYFCVGEYGSQRHRPHYHAIIFNANSADIQAAWSAGGVFFGTVTAASVGYVLKYMMKPASLTKKFARDDREPQFQRCSKGIGIHYLTSAMVAYHHADLTNRLCVWTMDGKFAPMPRYYKLKIYSEDERNEIAHSYLERQEQIRRTQLQVLKNKGWSTERIERYELTRQYNSSQRVYAMGIKDRAFF